MKLKKGDQVMVTAGKDKGRKGKVEKVFPKLDKVLVSGINIYKRHLKPQGEKKPGGIVDVVKPLPVGNLALWCLKCKKPTRVGYQTDQKKSISRKAGKYRICRKCQSVI